MLKLSANPPQWCADRIEMKSTACGIAFEKKMRKVRNSHWTAGTAPEEIYKPQLWY